MDISAERLEELITAKKQITAPPKKGMTIERQCKRNQFDAYAPELDESFHVFMRQNCILPDDFSVGLMWNRKDGEPIILFRCNGPHGGNENVPHKFCTHIHRLNLEKAVEDIFKENDTTETKEYSTFEDAIFFFLTHCGFDTAEMQSYFPFLYNISLF
ncbi:MAG: hypothetical protein IJ741_01895 [Schwartzia sp.]|nr:hypothetical protein [Schwartzia sp. (in: firmicutes)]